MDSLQVSKKVYGGKGGDGAKGLSLFCTLRLKEGRLSSHTKNKRALGVRLQGISATSIKAAPVCCHPVVTKQLRTDFPLAVSKAKNSWGTVLNRPSA